MEKENKKKRVYISLPIKGYDIEERKDAAMQMEVRLHGAGYDVFNPLGDGWVAGLTDCEYMRRDLKELLYCDAVIFMKGWNRSAGCHTEFMNAVACGMEIWFDEQVNIQL